MSFSQTVKQEILLHLPQSRHCRIAELLGIYFLCGSHDLSAAVPYIRFSSEKLDVARMCFTLLRKTFNITVSSCVRKSRSYSYIISAFRDETENVCEALKSGDDIRSSVMLLTERDCCKRAFLKGAFLAAGSLNNPERSYHLEIVCDDEPHALILRDIMESFDIASKVAVRKKDHLVYVKEGDGIIDLLNIMEANRALLSMENTRILKEMRNRVNRSVNCETANIKKTVGAAVKQIDDIKFLMECGVFKDLDENLRQIAELRLENQEATLTELGNMLDPPVGKSGVNHRLRKLSNLAGEIRGA